jgi:tetratricopeptide (TPR) repeat protein
MSRNISIKLGFVISKGGTLIDAGVVREWRKERNLYRLPIKMLEKKRRNEVPEQLGLLFALYHKYGNDPLKLTLNRIPQPFLLAYDNLGPEGRNPKDYPGLVNYFKKKVSKLHKSLPITTEHALNNTEINGITIGEDRVFTSQELSSLFAIGGEKGSKIRGIRIMTDLNPDQMYLLEAEREHVTEIYDGLRNLNIEILDKYKIGSKKAHHYIHAFQATIASKISTKDISGDQLAREIQGWINKVKNINILIKPSNWEDKVRCFDEQFFEKILVNIPILTGQINDEEIKKGFVVALNSLSSENHNARLMLAIFYYLINQPQKALSEIQTYSELNKKDSVSKILTGHIYSELGLYKTAEKEYKNAVSLGDSVSGTLGLIQTHILAGNIQEATKWLKRVSKSSESEIFAILNSKFLRLNGEFEQALKKVNAIYLKNSENVFVIEQRAWCLYAMKKYKESLREARCLMKLNPYAAYPIISGLLCFSGKIRFAKRFLQKMPADVQEKSPFQTIRQVRKIYYNENKYRNSARYILKMCRNYPNRYLLRLWLAVDLRSIGKLRFADRLSKIDYDINMLSQYEIIEYIQQYIMLGNYYEAPKLMCHLKKKCPFDILVDEISTPTLMWIYLGLRTNLMLQLSGEIPGSWRDTIGTFNMLYSASQNHEISKHLRYEPLICMTAVTTTPELTVEWLNLYQSIKHDEILATYKMLACWKLFNNLKSYPGKIILDMAIYDLCIRALKDGIIKSDVDQACLCLAGTVVLKVNHSKDKLSEHIDYIQQKVMGYKITKFTPTLIYGYCRYLFELCCSGFLKEALETVRLLKTYKNKLNSENAYGGFLYFVSLGLYVSVILESNEENTWFELYSEIEKRCIDMNVSDIIEAIFNKYMAITLFCSNRRGFDDNSFYIQIIEPAINTIRIAPITDNKKVELICVYLKHACLVCYNSFRDDLADTLFRLTENTVSSNDYLAPFQVKLQKMRNQVLLNRPLKYNRLIDFRTDFKTYRNNITEKYFEILMLMKSIPKTQRHEILDGVSKTFDSIESTRWGVHPINNEIEALIKYLKEV